MSTLNTKIIWGHVQRPWGFEVRVDFVDENGCIYHEILMFPENPLPNILDEAVITRRTDLENRLEMMQQLRQNTPLRVDTPPDMNSNGN